jgi:hypothetical protein
MLGMDLFRYGLSVRQLLIDIKTPRWKKATFHLARRLHHQVVRNENTPKEKILIVPRVEVDDPIQNQARNPRDGVLGRQVEGENRETNRMHTKRRKFIRGRNALALDPRVAMEDEEQSPSKLSRHRDRRHRYRDALAPQVAGDTTGRGAGDAQTYPLPIATPFPKEMDRVSTHLDFQPQSVVCARAVWDRE